MSDPKPEDRAAACAEYAIADWALHLEQIGNGAFAAAATSRRNAERWSRQAADHYARISMPRRFLAAVSTALPFSLTNHGGTDDPND